MTRRISVHVDELALEGPGPHRPELIAEGLRRELQRLISERGADVDDSHHDHLQRSVTAQPTDSAVGRSVAKTVYDGMKR